MANELRDLLGQISREGLSAAAFEVLSPYTLYPLYQLDFKTNEVLYLYYNRSDQLISYKGDFVDFIKLVEKIPLEEFNEQVKIMLNKPIFM